MMTKNVAIFLLASMTIGMQEIDDASCSSAPVELDRSLIQHQKAWTAPLHVAESATTGKAMQHPVRTSLEFTRGAGETRRLTVQAYSDYPSPGSGVTGNVTKECLYMPLGPSEAVPSPIAADLHMYGFATSTAGLKNVNAGRIWTKDPSAPDAYQVYGITIEMPAEDHAYEWSYHVEFANAPPAALKIWPENNKVGKVGNFLIITMTCDDVDICKDHSFVISAVQLAPLTEGLAEISAEPSAGAGASKTSPSKLSQDASQCPLPPNAQWGEVRLEGLPPFNMALRTGDDVLSGSVMRTGNWPELTNVSVYGPPGHALDIGGNIGYYTFALAHGGWKVYTFEPMSENLALLKATLCENPSIAANVKLFEMGLSEKDTTCTMMVNPRNRGNGQVMCGDTSVWPDGEVTGQFSLRRLEDILAANPIPSVDYMKLDVEGYECEVLKGAPSFFEHYRPRLIKTEVWSKIASCTPQQYMEMFTSKGYKLANEDDMECKSPIAGPDDTLSRHNGVSDFYLCSS